MISYSNCFLNIIISLQFILYLWNGTSTFSVICTYFGIMMIMVSKYFIFHDSFHTWCQLHKYSFRLALIFLRMEIMYAIYQLMNSVNIVSKLYGNSSVDPVSYLLLKFILFEQSDILVIILRNREIITNKVLYILFCYGLISQCLWGYPILPLIFFYINCSCDLWKDVIYLMINQNLKIFKIIKSTYLLTSYIVYLIYAEYILEHLIPISFVAYNIIAADRICRS